MEWTVCPSVVHLLSTAWSSSVEPMDKCAHLNWENSTVLYSVDMPAHSLKVETRVRIPLG
jgi:hypothetical protein